MAGRRQLRNGASATVAPRRKDGLDEGPARGSLPVREATHDRLLSAVRSHLSKPRAVEAVYVTVEADVFHVYSVVSEYDPAVYEKLMRQEARLEEAFPGVRFDFHTRASQGREPSLAVPFEAQCVFVRR